MTLRTTASSAARSTPAMPRQIAEGTTCVSASVFSITLCSTFSSASSPTPCRFAPSSRADLVLSDGIRSPGTLVLEGERIVDVVAGTRPGGAGVQHVDLAGHVIVPGFIDVHVHGVDG